MKLKPGDALPEFQVKDQDGNNFDSRQMKGQPWVMYFYPRDLTPTCTIQACQLRDHYSKLRDAGITVVGVSADSEKSHRRFIEKHKLPFTLLADEQREVVKLLGVWGPKKFMGRSFDGIHRTTFLMDENNTIVGIIDKPKAKIHAHEILEMYAQITEKSTT